MTTVGDMMFHLGGVPVTVAHPVMLAGGKWYFLDPTNGKAGNNGTSPDQACSSIETLYSKLRDGYNDGIIFIGGTSAASPAASITWSKSYTHLIGASGGLPGVGQRCRVSGTAALDLSPLITISGSGCVFQNIQFYNGKDADTDSNCVTVSGSRNEFVNCFIAGMAHATPAARAGSTSLVLSGSENVFKSCGIGLDTVTRGAANTEASITGARNKFWDCEFLSQSETAAKTLVTVGEGAWVVEFKDCLFRNYSINWAQALNNAISVTAVSTHYVILRGNVQFVGCTGVADTVTRVYGAGAAPNAGMFLSTNPTT